jgi:isoprene-epoxide---glutathione S-transferase
MVLTVYGYVPAWGLPDISPYVTKVIFYLKMTNTPFHYESQNLAQLDKDAPHGKLPYIVDDDGTKVADSNQIIEYLEAKHSTSLDRDLSPFERAVSLAFERLVSEHLYWSGVIEPRWRSDEGLSEPFLIFHRSRVLTALRMGNLHPLHRKLRVLEKHIDIHSQSPQVQGAEVTPELRKVLDEFRVRILAGFNGQGMGRRDTPTVLQIYKKDVDAVSDFLDNKQYALGDQVHTIDASLYAMLRHLVDQPQKWEGTGYVESKPNLAAYLERMRKRFEM